MVTNMLQLKDRGWKAQDRGAPSLLAKLQATVGTYGSKARDSVWSKVTQRTLVTYSAYHLSRHLRASFHFTGGESLLP